MITRILAIAARSEPEDVGFGYSSYIIPIFLYLLCVSRTDRVPVGGSRLVCNKPLCFLLETAHVGDCLEQSRPLSGVLLVCSRAVDKSGGFLC